MLAARLTSASCRFCPLCTRYPSSTGRTLAVLGSPVLTRPLGLTWERGTPLCVRSHRPRTRKSRLTKTNRATVLVFYIGYIIFELPSNIALKRFGAAMWLSLLGFSFGLITVGMGLVKNYGSLVVLRIFLGAMEAVGCPSRPLLRWLHSILTTSREYSPAVFILYRPGIGGSRCKSGKPPHGTQALLPLPEMYRPKHSRVPVSPSSTAYQHLCPLSPISLHTASRK